MKTLIFIIPALTTTIVGLFFLLKVPVGISDTLKLNLIMVATFIVLSFGLITLIIKVLKNDR